ncbi:MAG: hypothetical protein HC869_18845, partial [Rhodospirillales bacterium]|nr:hypothetical protein [Rhodospirillales bacterium]
MSTKRYGVLQGWPLVGIAVLAIGLCIVIILATTADSIDGVRRIIRVTARTSVALFVLAFTASALW